MQRIIKFRCFDNLSPKMYTGHSLAISANGDISFLDCTGNWIEPEEGRVIAMQFTGAKDDAGLEIYEGDIIATGDGKIYVVEWNDDTCKFQLSDGSDINDGNRYNTFKAIVGNIYENPTLIPK